MSISPISYCNYQNDINLKKNINLRNNPSIPENQMSFKGLEKVATSKIAGETMKKNSGKIIAALTGFLGFIGIKKATEMQDKTCVPQQPALQTTEKAASTSETLSPEQEINTSELNTENKTQTNSTLQGMLNFKPAAIPSSALENTFHTTRRDSDKKYLDIANEQIKKALDVQIVNEKSAYVEVPSKVDGYDFHYYETDYYDSKNNLVCTKRNDKSARIYMNDGHFDVNLKTGKISSFHSNGISYEAYLDKDTGYFDVYQSSENMPKSSKINSDELSNEDFKENSNEVKYDSPGIYTDPDYEPNFPGSPNMIYYNGMWHFGSK